MIRWSTTAVVVLLATVAAVVSYRHAYEVIVAHGETGFTAVLVPLTIDGLIFASSMVLLDSARRGLKVPWLARVALVLGIAATLAANVMHGIAHGVIGAVVAAWPAVALVVSYELLMGLIRRGHSVSTLTVSDLTQSATVGVSPTDVPAVPAAPPAPTPVLTPAPDELFPVAAQRFSDDLSEGRVPTLAIIKRDLKVGQPRAVRIRAYLGQLAEVAR